jgi:general secretion pathway protein D
MESIMENEMKHEHIGRIRTWVMVACLALGLANGAYAQPFGGGFGGQTLGGGRSGAQARQYPNNTQVGDAIITIEPETRKVIIIADDSTQDQIKAVIESLDHPRPQVLIKVVFLEITYNKDSDIGVEGGFSRKFANSTTSTVANVFGLSGLGLGAGSNAPAANVYGQALQNFSPVPPGAGLYQILGQDYQVTLRAIAQAGKAEILSRPSILARNNQPATISLGQQVPLVSNTRFDAVNGQINTITYQSVGIILRVTPFITTDGMVEMIVSPETSQLADRSQWVPISAGALAPVINQRSADTVVVVPDGQTVIIGGLMENQKVETESRVPVLGSIPLLGNLFKRKIKSDAKTELMIFLTPHIVMMPAQLAGLTADERAKSSIKPQGMTDQELDRFLDKLPVKPAPEPPKVDAPKSSKNRK